MQIGIVNEWWWCLCRLYANVEALMMIASPCQEGGEEKGNRGERDRQTLAYAAKADCSFEAALTNPFISPRFSSMGQLQAGARSLVPVMRLKAMNWHSPVIRPFYDLQCV